MKKKVLFTFSISLCLGLIYINANLETEAEKQQREYADFIANHEYSKRKPMSGKELKEIPKKDRPDLAYEQDFLRTFDPNTKQLHQERLVEAINIRENYRKEALKRRNEEEVTWESIGPKTVSGRVRAIMFDPNDSNSKVVFAGGVSGGLWKNNDITDEASAWVQLNPNMSNFAISAIAFDPVVETTFYAGTGEGWGNVDAVNGAGIWKSTDGGVTWSNLASTVDFEYVYDIVVRDEGGSLGVIYAAMRDTFGIASTNTDLFRSTDGGATWTKALDNSIRDLEIGADNKIWAGDSNGSIYSSTDGTNWTSLYTSTLSSLGRVELACAPSNADVVYGLVASQSALGEIVYTSDGGVNWSQKTEPNDATDGSIPEDDMTRGQAWYDLIAVVNPSDENEVYIGGVNSFKSTNAGTSWRKITSWSDFYDQSVSFAHADQHNMIFRPNNNEMLITNDGGVFYVPDVSQIPSSGIGAFNKGIFARNLDFNITQFYSGAIDPINPNGFAGGTQDNGTHYISTAGFSDSEEVFGGDGGFSFIDQTATNETRGYYHIVSTTRNNFHLLDYSTGTEQWFPLIRDSDQGSFINPADYDDENNILYTYESPGVVSKIELSADGEDQSTPTISSMNIAQLGGNQVTHLRVSPYNASNRALFLGTLNGTVVKVVADGTIESFRGGNLTGSISCIEIGATDDELLLTYFNYGVRSVFYSTNGGTNWTNVEGNLPDVPVRWALFNPLNRKEAIVATEAGIWKTSDVTAASVVWEPASSGMGSVRVDMLQYRASDNKVLAATHGRGLFTMSFTDGTTSVNEVLQENKAFTVYPTISDGNFTIFAKNELGNSNMIISDLLGKRVYNSQLDFNQNEKQVISTSLKSGIYIVNLIGENGNNSSRKIIIE